MNEFQKVVLYYPNGWRRNIGSLAKLEDKKFNWFLCSKKFLDPESNLYVAEIAENTLFYDEKTGNTFKSPSEKVKLLISDKDDINLINKYGYKGYAKLCECDLKPSSQDECITCKEVEFYFLKDVLVKSTKENLCPIISYSKKNNIVIRSVYKDFPTIEEIERVVDKYDCNVVCKVLYEYIKTYLTKI